MSVTEVKNQGFSMVLYSKSKQIQTKNVSQNQMNGIAESGHFGNHTQLEMNIKYEFFLDFHTENFLIYISNY